LRCSRRRLGVATATVSTVGSVQFRVEVGQRLVDPFGLVSIDVLRVDTGLVEEVRQRERWLAAHDSLTSN
jgi:hypothetical protein